MKINSLKSSVISPERREKYLQVVSLARKFAISVFTAQKIDSEKAGKVVELYQKAIELIPSEAEPYLSLAYISWKMGKYESAVALLKTIKKYNPLDLKSDEMLELIESDYKRKLALDKNRNSSQKVSIPTNTISPNLYSGMFKIKRS